MAVHGGRGGAQTAQAGSPWSERTYWSSPPEGTPDSSGSGVPSRGHPPVGRQSPRTLDPGTPRQLLTAGDLSSCGLSSVDPIPLEAVASGRAPGGLGQRGAPVMSMEGLGDRPGLDRACQARRRVATLAPSGFLTSEPHAAQTRRTFGRASPAAVSETTQGSPPHRIGQLAQSRRSPGGPVRELFCSSYLWGRGRGPATFPRLNPTAVIYSAAATSSRWFSRASGTASSSSCAEASAGVVPSPPEERTSSTAPAPPASCVATGT